jgi:hypothetical protein
MCLCTDIKRKGSMSALAAVCAVLLAVSTFARLAIAQSPEHERRIEAVRVKLNVELELLSSENYKHASAEFLEPIERGTAKRFQLQLEAGTKYAIVGACDGSCDHVQLSLYQADGALLVSSPEKQAVVIIGGTPTVAGSYALELAVPGCREEICQAGFIIARHEMSSGSLKEGASFVAHVSSERSREDVLATYSKLKELAPAELGSKEPFVQEVDLGSQGVWHRLRIGPPMSEADAQVLCAAIKAAGHQYCSAQSVEKDADAKAVSVPPEREAISRFDGTWTVTSKSESCGSQDGYSIAVSKGVIAGLDGRLRGKMSATGAARWTLPAATDGALVRYEGTFGEKSGTGRFKRIDGSCEGTFTARRRGPKEKSTDGPRQKSEALERVQAEASVLVAEKYEPPAGAVPWGKAALVDDGTCPRGQIKEITGGNLNHGMPRQRRCIAR